jgi:hypothetical protein
MMLLVDWGVGNPPKGLSKGLWATGAAPVVQGVGGRRGEPGAQRWLSTACPHPRQPRHPRPHPLRRYLCGVGFTKLFTLLSQTH